MTSIKHIDNALNTWEYYRDFDIELCGECTRLSQTILNRISPELVRERLNLCGCKDKHAEKHIKEIKKEIGRCGVIDDVSIEVSSFALPFVRVYVLIFKDNPESLGLFKLKNLDKKYRKVYNECT